MKIDLEPAKNVLRSFLSEIDEIKKIRKGISEPIFTPFNIKDQTPDLSVIEFKPAPDSCWLEEDAYVWIYAEARRFRALMHKPNRNDYPDYYLQPAFPLFPQWRDEEKDVIYRGNIIPNPGDTTLIDYLLQLKACIEEENEKRAVWIKSLKSFAQFIRDDISFELQGTLDCIFPYKMEIRRDYSLEGSGDEIKEFERSYILRNIENPVYPIDILTASNILRNLANAVLEGRPNLQHSAAETLGFAWLCNAVGSARLMTRENIVHSIPLTAFKSSEIEKSQKLFQPQYHANLQTLLGFKDMPISKTIHDFLVALPRSPGNVSIFSKPISTLLRILYDKGVKKLENAESLGKITFRTFMSQSTHFFGRRSFPMKTSTKSKKK